MTDPRWDPAKFGETVDVKRSQVAERATPKAKLPSKAPTPDIAKPQVKPSAPDTGVPPERAPTPNLTVHPDGPKFPPIELPADWQQMDPPARLKFLQDRMNADFTKWRGEPTTFDFTGFDTGIAFNLANTYRDLANWDPDTARRIDNGILPSVAGSNGLGANAIAVAHPGTAHPGGIGPKIKPSAIVFGVSYVKSMKFYNGQKANNAGLSFPHSTSSMTGDPSVTLIHEFGHHRQFRFLDVAMRDVGKSWSPVTRDDGFGLIPDSSNWKETQDLRYLIPKQTQTQYGHSKSSEGFAEGVAERALGISSPDLDATFDKWDELMGVSLHLPADRHAQSRPFDELTAAERDQYWQTAGPYLELPGMREHYPDTAKEYDAWLAAKPQAEPTADEWAAGLKKLAAQPQNQGKIEPGFDEPLEPGLNVSHPSPEYEYQEKLDEYSDAYNMLPAGVELPYGTSLSIGDTMAVGGHPAKVIGISNDGTIQVQNTDDAMYQWVKNTDSGLAVVPAPEPAYQKAPPLHWGAENPADWTDEELAAMWSIYSPSWETHWAEVEALQAEYARRGGFKKGQQVAGPPRQITLTPSPGMTREAGNVYVGDEIALPGDLAGVVTGVEPLQGEWMRLDTSMGSQTVRMSDPVTVITPASQRTPSAADIFPEVTPPTPPTPMLEPGQVQVRSIEDFGAALDVPVRRRADQDIEAEFGIMHSVQWKLSHGYKVEDLNPASELVAYNLYNGDPAAYRTLAGQKLHDREFSSDPETLVNIDTTLKNLQGNARYQTAVSKYGAVPVVGVTEWQGMAGGVYLTDAIAITDLGASANTVGAKDTDFNIDPSLNGTLRHEYGHHVHSLLSDEDDNRWGDALTQWGGLLGGPAAMDKFLDDNYVDHPELLSHGLSLYGRTNYKEAFAETFNLVTRPDFDRSTVDPRILPMVDLMLEFIG